MTDKRRTDIQRKIDDIRRQWANGIIYAEVPTDDPEREYRRIYEAQKRRGYCWQIRTTNDRVYVFR